MDVGDFIGAYERALQTQEWKNIDPLFHDNVCVTFSTGAIHMGKANVKEAFERNFSLIKSEAYSMREIRWIYKNESVAAYNFEYFWEGLINGKLVSGSGVGTSVLINEGGKWVLLTENLSRKVE